MKTPHRWCCGALGAALAGLSGAAVLAAAQGPPAAPEAPALPRLEVSVGGLTADGSLPASAAYCPPIKMDPSEYNISPSVAWSGGPPATRSYALIMTDLDVPKDLSLIDPGRCAARAVHPLGAHRHPALDHGARARRGRQRVHP
jgi:hypothetical protein